MKYPVKTCLICGKEFVDPKHPKRKYCSHACATESQKRTVTITCLHCGTQFDVPQRRAFRKFCSPKCSNRYNKQPDPDKKAVFKCEWCSVEFEEWAYRKPRFCSNQCRSEYAARLPKPWQRRPENFVELTCEVCGKSYTVHRAQVTGRKSRFCSVLCRAEWTSKVRSGAGNVNYRGGTVRYRGRNWDRQKRIAVKRDGYKCQVCGKKLGRTKWDWAVHHIKPYREFNGDYLKANELTNLITLCRRCHGRVEAGKIPCPRPLF